MALPLLAVAIFVGGVFFGAFLQKRVGHAMDITPPLPTRKLKPIKEPDLANYEHPQRGYEL